MNLGYLKFASVGFNFLLKRPRLPTGRLISLTLETTNICNFRWFYGPQGQTDRHFMGGKGTMPIETFKKVLDNILEDFSPRYVSLHRDGEPLCNTNLHSYVAYASSRGIKVGISSNCSLLTKKRADELIDAGLAFIKSDFCSDAHTYERLRVGGQWKKTYEGMINLLSSARERGVVLNMAITDISTHGLPPDQASVNMHKLRASFKDFADWVTVLPVHFHSALGESIQTLSSKGDRQYTLCHHPWVHITVDFMGRVVPCCRDLRSEYVCGDLLDTPMREIWNNAQFVRLRDALRRRRPSEISICAKCDLPYRGSYAGRTFTDKATSLLFGKMWHR
jgi:radical SAM protein with 4Fe4S-binding SPASM domain